MIVSWRMKEITKLIQDVNPDFFAVESYANKFSKGRSTARTIIVLSFFNELTSMACLKTLGYEPEKYAVVTIRSSLSKLFGSKIISKEDSFEYIKNNINGFVANKNRNGRISKEAFDEADAIAVALTFFQKNFIK